MVSPRRLVPGSHPHMCCQLLLSGHVLIWSGAARIEKATFAVAKLAQLAQLLLHRQSAPEGSGMMP